MIEHIMITIMISLIASVFVSWYYSNQQIYTSYICRENYINLESALEHQVVSTKQPISQETADALMQGFIGCG
jgi:hypothetical protein